MFMPSAPWLAKAAKFRQSVSLPVFHAAKIQDLATARYAIRENLVDMIGMTRAHIAEPHLMRLVREGREEEARPCVGASYCRSFHATCIHNPATSRETTLPHDVPKASVRKRVLVVGAGPAGLEAARVSALRGHEVTVMEANSEAGGQVLLAATGSWRKNLIGIVDWRVASLERLGVDIRYNTYAEISDLVDHNPDVVVIATGGLPDMDRLQGVDLCKSVLDALSDTPPKAGSVLVYDGTGRHNAYLAAERMIDAGVDVQMALLDSLPAQETGGRGDGEFWMKKVALWKIPVFADIELIEVSAHAGRKRASFRHQLTGEIVQFDADYIVVERGMVSMSELFEDARMYSSNDGQLDFDAFSKGAAQPEPSRHGFSLYRIGDASASRDIHTAIYDAYRLCIAL
jgi:dimethylglycine catabolism A